VIGSQYFPNEVKELVEQMNVINKEYQEKQESAKVKIINFLEEKYKPFCREIILPVNIAHNTSVLDYKIYLKGKLNYELS